MPVPEAYPAQGAGRMLEQILQCAGFCSRSESQAKNMNLLEEQC